MFPGQQDQDCCVHARDGAETGPRMSGESRGGRDPQSEPGPLGRRQHRDGHQRGDGHQRVLGRRYKVDKIITIRKVRMACGMQILQSVG